MTGEMSKHDLTPDGEWGLYVKTAEILGVELKPFDVYQGPYMIVNGQELWFTSEEADESEHCVYNNTTDTLHPLARFNPYAYSHITPEELAAFILDVAAPEHHNKNG